MRRIQKDHADQKYTLDGFKFFVESVIKWETRPQFYQEIAAHQEYWLEYIFRGFDESKNVLLEAPWDHGKTWIVCVPLPLYLIGVNPNIRGATICAAEQTAMKRLSSMRLYIQRDRDYREAFPHIEPHEAAKWTAHELTIKRDIIANEPTWTAQGIKSSGMGKRLDILIADDICDVEDQMFEKVRDKKDFLFNGTWMSRLVGEEGIEGGRTGVCFYIATPWHFDDCTARTKRLDGWLAMRQQIARDFSCIEMYRGRHDDYRDAPHVKIPLWKRTNQKYLAKKQSEMPGKVFRAGFHFDLSSEEDATFDWARIDLASFKHKISPRELYKPTWPMVGGVDISSESRKGTTIGVAARAPDGTRVPVHMEAGNWAVGPETARQIIRVDEVIRALGGRVGVWMVENNGIQEVVINCLREIDKSFKVRGFQTGKNKADWIYGLPGLASQLENGGWAFGMKDHTFSERTCRIFGQKDCAWCRLVREIKEHPFSRTSDLVMMLWFIDVGLGKKKKIKLEKPIVLGQPRQFAAKTSERKFKAPPVRIYP